MKQVHSPPGTIIGKIEQDWSLCFPNFTIRDASGNPVLRIEGPLCTWSCFGDVEFEVLSIREGQKVGKISKSKIYHLIKLVEIDRSFLRAIKHQLIVYDDKWSLI